VRKRQVDAIELLQRRGLPASLESERFVLGAILVDGRERMEAVRTALSVASFSLQRNVEIWTALCGLFDAGMPLDRVSLAKKLMADGNLEAAGGMTGICDLDAGMPQGISIEGHVRLLHEKATLRQAIVALDDAMGRCLSEDGQSGELLEYARGVIERVSADAPTTCTFRSAGEVIEAVGVQEFLQPSRLKDGVPFPQSWHGVKALVPVMRAGALVIVAGRTSAGKSALALHLGVNAAMVGYPTVVLSMEMGADEWSQRAACHLANVDNYAHLNGKLGKDERAALMGATMQLQQLPLYFDDRTGVSVPALHAAMLRMKPRPQLLIVDYLQLMESAGKHEQRHQAVSEISRGLKRLAMSMKIPVIALSQFSRENAKEKRKPELHDLKESGDIENDANVALLLHSDGDIGATSAQVELIVAKNRGGRRGSVRMTFTKPFYRFEENP